MQSYEVKDTLLNSINELAKRMNRPNILTPKGSFSSINQLDNDLIEYDSSLMPSSPQFIELNKYMDSLINAYNNI